MHFPLINFQIRFAQIVSRRRQKALWRRWLVSGRDRFPCGWDISTSHTGKDDSYKSQHHFQEASKDGSSAIGNGTAQQTSRGQRKRKRELNLPSLPRIEQAVKTDVLNRVRVYHMADGRGNGWRQESRDGSFEFRLKEKRGSGRVVRVPRS
jgi:hypothetical protein